MWLQAAATRLNPKRRLGSRGRWSALPTGPFSCGRVELTSSSSTRSIITPRSSNTTNFSNGNSSETLEDGYFDENVTDIFDYYELAQSDPETSGTYTHVRSPRSDSESHVWNSSEASNVTETDRKRTPSSAFFPTIPTIAAQDNTDQRIVGGDAASAGEIPWQVPPLRQSLGVWSTAENMKQLPSMLHCGKCRMALQGKCSVCVLPRVCR